MHHPAAVKMFDVENYWSKRNLEDVLFLELLRNIIF
jgi:hypothetical protein